MASLFDRIVCGIDETPESLEAVRQAARLRTSDGSLHLFSAVYLVGAVAAGWSAARIADELEREAGEALRRAEALAGDGATSRLVNGPAVRSLLRELERKEATLVCVGTHERRRAEGILFDYVGTVMLHEAPTAVLVARPPKDPDAFPQSIVVGVDGSEQSAAAQRVAYELAERFGATVRAIASSHGLAADELPDAEIVDAAPVDALADASRNADLVVVGSRGVRGLRALGSVSERIAHRAQCSVLVVRGPGVGESLPPLD